jgi:DNA-binding IclR family transcriptional regulator
MPKPDGDRSFKGVNFFDIIDQALLRAVQRSEFNIHGLARRDLMRLLPEFTPSSVSRQLRRLRVHGLLKRAANTYRYYLTRTGRLVIAALERITTFTIIPALANA